ncbi:hypothetical protein JCM19302_2011 [Jejuia pallidilutea]|uniref:Uncharacterized protein n=2 Tax=Jejuia pallidilutea TaxID=504487 RepID=A0A090W3P8_9FLAO|nr:hypothetical protein JCM19302_2011 [Jejuia pallidilutea]
MVNTSCQNKEEEVKKETKENTIEKLSERPNILWLVTEDMGRIFRLLAIQLL